LEWLILGYSVICLYQCCGEKFSTRKPWSNALFLFHYKPSKFCFGQAAFQFNIDAGNEFAKPVVIYSLFGQSDAKSRSIYWFGFIGRLEPKSCVYFSCRYSSKGSAKCCHHGCIGFPNYHSADCFIDEIIQCCICTSAYYFTNYCSFINCIGYYGYSFSSYSVPIPLERLSIY